MPEAHCDLWLPYVARDILQALEFIHQNGYVHKDLHPGNIFASQVRDHLDPGKEPVWMFKIGDLGISRLESDIHIFNTILAPWMVPPEYLNPMQFGQLDRRVDIYHAGHRKTRHRQSSNRVGDCWRAATRASDPDAGAVDANDWTV